MEESLKPQTQYQLPRKEDLANVKSSVGERMKQIIGSDLRLDLLKQMKKKGLGCQGQESFLKMMNVGCKAKNKISTKERMSYLALTTEIKIQDAIKDLTRKKTLFKKDKRRLEKALGRNSRKMRNTMKNISRENKDYKERLKTKYRRKIEYLEKKHKDETKTQIPDTLRNYENIQIFKKTQEITEKKEQLEKKTEQITERKEETQENQIK